MPDFSIFYALSRPKLGLQARLLAEMINNVNGKQVLPISVGMNQLWGQDYKGSFKTVKVLRFFRLPTGRSLLTASVKYGHRWLVASSQRPGSLDVRFRG
jgi:hypothetical protein